MNTVEDIINQEITRLKASIPEYLEWAEKAKTEATKNLYIYFLERDQKTLAMWEAILPKISTLTYEEYMFLTSEDMGE